MTLPKRCYDSTCAVGLSSGPVGPKFEREYNGVVPVSMKLPRMPKM